MSDGRRVGEIRPELAASDPMSGHTIPVLALLRVIERRAGAFAAATRLDDLVARERVVLHQSDFRDSDFEHGPSWLD